MYNCVSGWKSRRKHAKLIENRIRRIKYTNRLNIKQKGKKTRF